MSSAPLSQFELVEALLRGDHKAARQYVDEQKHRVLNICFHFVRDADEAADLAQETFVEALRSIGDLRDARILSTWTYRIAISKCISHLRKQKRLKRGAGLRVAFSQPDIAEARSPDSTNPHESLEMQELQNILGQALETLPRNQRIAFVLSKYDEVSSREIAMILRTTVSAVESLIHRARTNLQKKLYNYYRKSL